MTAVERRRDAQGHGRLRRRSGPSGIDATPLRDHLPLPAERCPQGHEVRIRDRSARRGQSRPHRPPGNFSAGRRGPSQWPSKRRVMATPVSFFADGGTSFAGLAAKKPVGLEHEADVRRRHHRVVLRPRDVRVAEGVPEHDVGVLDRAVLLGPAASGRRRRGSGSGSRRRAYCSSSAIRRDPDVVVRRTRPASATRRSARRTGTQLSPGRNL